MAEDAPTLVGIDHGFSFPCYFEVHGLTPDCLSPANSTFVAAMEDVLAVYTRAHDPDCPVVCLDETSKQLIAETRVPVPMKPGPARSDYEYERNGTANRRTRRPLV